MSLVIQPSERRARSRRKEQRRARERQPRVAAWSRRLLFEQFEGRALLAAVITVNSTGDADNRDSELTLREAILINNRTLAVASLTAAEQGQVSGTPSDSDRDTIGFNIPPSDPRHFYYTNDNVSGQVAVANVIATTAATDAALANPDPDWNRSWYSIQAASQLPVLSEAVVIDGYTQAGSSHNALADGFNGVLRVELDGSKAGNASGIVIAGGQSTVRGLVINRFQGDGTSDKGDAIVLQDAGGNVVTGNLFGTDVSGTRSLGNYRGVEVWKGSSDNLIGGIAPSERNIVSGSTLRGISIDSVDGTVVQGNFVGTNAAGTAALANQTGIFLIDRGTGLVLSTLIGGTTTGARNVISGNSSIGISVNRLQETTIQGNYIGTDVTGSKKVGNRFGVALQESRHNTIGGLASGAGNVISGNTESGIAIASAFETHPSVWSDENVVQGNRIGTNAAGTQALGNGGDGIVFDAFQASLSASNNLIEQNIVAHNGGGGIVIEPSVEGNNLGNALVQNSIYSNGGLGIDLNDDGPTANDPGDSDTGANNRQNFPVLSSVEVSGGNLLVKGSLNSLANATFRISFFASPAIDASGFGEGQTAVGSIDVTSNDSGNATIQFSVNGLAHMGKLITSTATRLVNGSPRDTSEFSAAVSLWMVTNTLDSGPGSLREAINFANALPNADRDGIPGAEADVITFAIPGSGVQTISVATALPVITEAVIIDGYSQAGASPNTNAIDDPDPAKRGLNGTLLIELAQQADSTLGINGLSITADDCTIRGLVINRFSAGSGIRISGDNNVITGNYIGTNAAGTAAAANGGRGIFLVDAAQRNRIGTNADGIGDAAERNLLSGNVLDGVTIFGEGVSFNVVAGNLIGTNAAGTSAIANQVNGVGIFTGASFNTIGGHSPASRNVLSGNTLSGVVMADPNTAGNTVAGNYIGTNVAGSEAVANARDGVFIWSGASNNRIGTDANGIVDLLERNVISGNASAGVRILDPATTQNIVAGNFIGTDSTGAAELENRSRGVWIDSGASNNTVGGLVSAAANTIAFNRLAGVFVNSAGSTGNSILGNSIHSNGSLGIALDNDGVTANDTGDADAGPNNLQNFPDIDETDFFGGVLRVVYRVNAVASHVTFPLRVEFFKADDEQEGQKYLGFDIYRAADAAAGLKAVALNVGTAFAIGNGVVATASAATAIGIPSDTSEFSITRIATELRPWHNTITALDVNNSRTIEPLDALLVINYLNTGLPTKILPSAPIGGGPGFLDTTGNGEVEPLDALIVINALNAGLGGEGEGAVAASGGDASRVSDLDALLTMLAEDVAGQPGRRRRA